MKSFFLSRRPASSLLDPLCVIAGRARETHPTMADPGPWVRVARSIQSHAAKDRNSSEFLTIFMRIILKFIASLKSSSIHPAMVGPLSSGVLTPAEMQRLVADMVD
ncbi:hypothetical protein [Novosphingobium sp. KACC 22771]|uniref:hypothetical protein n=1 Tax=Novosphingobium sp. KACC 22771 TaxID=3025670 RepID=UPI002366DF16|nr:hypothetical protein [Novosphingobium sp. KACC 22771]WDF71743.1 hypothetical protein PQ467_13165 [Novosphingobium sp. KACC 22771]